MILDFQNIENIAVALPITSDSRELARVFASQQTNEQKAAQIFLNTLAVLIVKSYLDLLGIPTNLSNCDSWNLVMRTCNDVADLDILNLGKLECRPIRGTDSSCYIPMEVWNLRLGFVIVKIDDSFKKAELLGFVSHVTTEDLAISDLRPIETLIDHLHDSKPLTIIPSQVNLGQWLNNIFTEGWEAVSIFLDSEQLTSACNFRNTKLSLANDSKLLETNNSIRRAKLINFGVQMRDHQVVLLVEITPEKSDSIAVILQVHPHPDEAYLPQTLVLRVVESIGEVFMQAQARDQDNFIQLQFSGEIGERFSVNISLEDIELTERFQL